MTATELRDAQFDRIAAKTIGSGVGLIALMLTWLIGARIMSFVIGPPVGPSIAFGTALVVGLVVAMVQGRRLAATAESERLMFDNVAGPGIK